jgi:hypothetical protein
MPKPILNYFSDEQNISKDVDISMFFDEKTRDKQETKQGQIRDKQGTNKGQSGDKKSKQETKERQTRDKQGTNKGQNHQNIALEMLKLRGSQRKILMFFYDICKANNSLKTDPMNLQEIASKLCLKKETVKKSVQRLIDKKMIKRSMYQCGRKSFNIYQFSRIYFNRIRDKQGTNEAARGSSNILTPYKDITVVTTTTTPLRSVESVSPLDDVVNINLDEISEINIQQSHIKKLINHGIKKTVIQQSINALAYDLKNGFRKKTDFKISPLAFLIGILMKNEEYIAHDSFYQKEKLIIEQLREKKNNRDQRIREQSELSFSLWLSDLTIEGKLKILGLTSKEVQKLSKEMQNNMLFNYYIESIYPFERDGEILKKS